MKKFTIVLSILMVVAVLAGCNPTPAADNEPVTTTSTTTTTVAPTGPTTIPVADLLTVKEAKEIALQTAGVKEKEISALEIDLDYETKEARWDYEVDFYVGKVEYNIEIDAKTGSVIYYRNDHKDVSTKGTISTTSGTATVTTNAPLTTTAVPSEKDKLISQDEAKSIALKKAGATEDTVSNYRCEVDYDDKEKRWEYEIDFYVGKVEYDVEMDAVSGKILKFEKETEEIKHQATATTKPTFIDDELLWDYSVLVAGVAEEKIQDYKVELDYNEDAKRWEFEITFKVGRLEYEIIADAVSGDTISFNKELDD